MHSKITFIFLIFLHLSGRAQYNHVRNPNFENTYGTVNCAGCPTSIHTNMIHYWQQLFPWTMPIRTGILGAVGSPDHPCLSGPVGPHYGSALYHEYIVQELDKPLVTGKLYYLSYFYYGEPKTDVGIRFYTSRPEQRNSSYSIKDDGSAHIDGTQYVNSGIITTPVYGEWKIAYKYWVADNNYSYMAIGAFNGVNEYTSMDGIRVIEVGANACPEWNLIENVDYWDNISLTYKSSYVTAVGTSVDNAQTDGPVHIHNVSKITLKSEREVMMEADFSVDEGGELNAFIAPCNADCFPPSVNAGEDKFICSETSPIYIGIPTGYNPDLTYSWTSTPATFTSNLSCTNCPNPILLINATTLFGSAIYQVTATNACGQTATDNVNVFFDLHWMDFNATVNAYNINPDNYIDFDITCNNHTEWVQIEIYKNSDNSLVYSKQLKRGDNFTSIPFHWEIDQYLKVCDDYTLKIYSKNFCNPTLSNIQTIPWVRNKTITIGVLPNVFTPPNPPNAALCYNTTGVDEYEIYVYDPSGGALIYSNSGDYAPTGGCLWNGTCNGSLATCPTGYAPNGVYQIIVKFKNCLNQEDRAHFVHLFNDPKKQNDNTDNPINRTVTQLFPNPNNGIFTITPSSLLSTNYTIEITDNLNKVIYKVENKQDKTLSIDLSQYGKGIYFIRIYNTIENYFNKLIIN